MSSGGGLGRSGAGGGNVFGGRMARPSSPSSPRPSNTNIFINNVGNNRGTSRPSSMGGGYGGGYAPGGDYYTAQYAQKRKKKSLIGEVMSGILKVAFVVMITALICALIFGGKGDTPDSTIVRHPLSMGEAQGEVIVVRDDTGDGDWFDNKSVLRAAATEAYNSTGVKFGILATREVYGERSPSEAELAAYADEIYSEWFDDEAHLLLLVVDQPHRDGYHVYYKLGVSTVAVFDDQALDIMDSYLYRYWFTSMETSEMFAKVLTDTADHIMQVTPSPLATIIPIISFVAVISMLLIFIPLIFRAIARKKEADAEKMRAEAELLGTPIAGLDTSPESASALADKYLEQEHGIPQTPRYKAPENPLDDPYSPKPAGYAAKQAQMGFPKAQAVKPVVAPEETDLSEDNSMVFGTFEAFATAMRGLGSTDSDEALMARYELYKKENNIE